MGYRRTVLTGWPKREWLAIAIIAVVTAFLIGASAALVVTNEEIGSVTNNLNRNATVEYVDSPLDQETSKQSIVLPVTSITTNNSSHFVVGIPSTAPTVIKNASYAWADALLPRPPNNRTLLGPTNTTTQQQFQTGAGTQVFRVRPFSSGSIFPSDWRISNAQTARSLGQTGTLIIRPYPKQTATGQGLLEARLSAAGAYLEKGATSLMDLLWLLVLIEGTIVSVLIYSITRMSVNDRSTTIYTIRATGGARRQVLRLFTLRAGIRVIAGILPGICISVCLLFLASVATRLFEPSQIFTRSVMIEVLYLVTPLLCIFVVLGGTVGYLTVRMMVTKAPTAAFTYGYHCNSAKENLQSYLPKSVQRLFKTTIIPWRTLIPTTATLAVFVCTVLLVVSTTATLAPLATTTNQTVVDSSAPHPLASEVETEYATTIRAAGGQASPEILLPEVVGHQSQPYLVRGVNYTAFASVTETTLTAGHPPETVDQAVIGADLAQTLDVEIGEEILLGGAVVPGVTWVTVVGKYEATGITDDQLLVPLKTAQHLSRTSEGEVNLIRTKGVPPDIVTRSLNSKTATSGTNGTQIVITNYSIPRQIVAGRNVTASASLRNLGETTQSRTLSAELGSESRTRNVTLQPGERKTVHVTLNTSQTGTYEAQFEKRERNLTVVPADTVRLESRPEEAPPGSTFIVRAVNANDTPVTGANVSLSRQAVETNQNGIASLSVPKDPGVYTLTVDSSTQSRSSYPLLVQAETPRALSAKLKMPQPTVSGRSTPVAELQVTNPWNQQLTRTIHFQTTDWRTTKEVTLAPGERTTIETQLPTPQERIGSLQVSTDQGGTLATGTYFVVSPNKTATEYSSGSGIGYQGGITKVIDNLIYLQIAFVAFASLTVLGSIFIICVQGVTLQRRSIGIQRATGATPQRIRRLLAADGLRIGAVGTILAVIVGILGIHLFSVIGFLTAFGIRIVPYTPIWLVASMVGLCLGFVLLGTIFATIGSTGADPATQSATNK